VRGRVRVRKCRPQIKDPCSLFVYHRQEFNTADWCPWGGLTWTKKVDNITATPLWNDCSVPKLLVSSSGNQNDSRSWYSKRLSTRKKGVFFGGGERQLSRRGNTRLPMGAHLLLGSRANVDGVQSCGMKLKT
jgi:hypothetical protein